MKLSPTNRDVPHSSHEICLNLWYFADESGVVLRIAGKAYALVGTEAEKLRVLASLVPVDHLTAKIAKVPQSFSVLIDGREMHAATHASAIFQDHTGLFGSLMNELESALPKGICSRNGEYEAFALRLPQEPLCVTTCVLEREDGELVSRVKVGSDAEEPRSSG